MADRPAVDPAKTRLGTRILGNCIETFQINSQIFRYIKAFSLVLVALQWIRSRLTGTESAVQEMENKKRLCVVYPSQNIMMEW